MDRSSVLDNVVIPLLESSFNDKGSFHHLLGSFDPDVAYSVVSAYGGPQKATHALRGLSFKHQTEIPRSVKGHIKTAAGRWKQVRDVGSRALMGSASGRSPNLPNIKYEFNQNVSSHDGQIQGKVVQFRGWSSQDNAFMYGVSHHSEPARVTVHPEHLLKPGGAVARGRRKYESTNEDASYTQSMMSQMTKDNFRQISRAMPAIEGHARATAARTAYREGKIQSAPELKGSPGKSPSMTTRNLPGHGLSSAGGVHEVYITFAEAKAAGRQAIERDRLAREAETSESFESLLSSGMTIDEAIDKLARM